MVFSFTGSKMRWQSVISSTLAAALLTSSCAASAKNPGQTQLVETTGRNNSEVSTTANTLPKNSASSGRIEIQAGSPADTVRTFYKNLRERRFREALMMTNMRAAVEMLTDEEFKDLSPDFERLAGQIPVDLPINGEIITNNRATVTTQIPNEAGRPEIKEIELRREGEKWTVLMGDDESEAEARKQGKNYFFSLRISVHHEEVQMVMEQIAKAQAVYALQNGGRFGDLNTLVSQNFLPPDLKNSESTGYNFTIKTLDSDKKYFATAEPVSYGKSGKLSFLLESEGSSQKSRMKSEDKKGQPLRK